ncbi:hypothetical protein ACFDTO_23545 [Microbacteriaceae bacterium 4G12]
MAKKRIKVISYSKLFKWRRELRSITEKYQIKSPTQLKNWVKKYKECGEITDMRGKSSGMKGIPNPLKGKRVHFNTVEEERDYYKAQVEYLKKQYPNL